MQSRNEVNERFVKAVTNINTIALREALKEGADVNYVDKNGSTALSLLSTSGYSSAIRILFNHGGVDVNYSHPETGDTALMLAVKSDYITTVRFLLSRPDIKVNEVNKLGATAFTLACRFGSGAMVRVFIEHGQANVDCALPSSGSTPLILAVKNKKLDVVHALLLLVNGSEGKININAIDKDGYTALMWASKVPHPELVRMLLLKPGIDLSYADAEGLTALAFACREGASETARILIEHGGMDAGFVTKNGSTLLTLALESGYVEIIYCLFEHGVINVNHVTGDGSTALTIACSMGWPASIALLLEAGADIYYHRPDGLTVLNLALNAGKPDVAKPIVDHFIRMVNDADLTEKYNNHYKNLILCHKLRDIAEYLFKKAITQAVVDVSLMLKHLNFLLSAINTDKERDFVARRWLRKVISSTLEERVESIANTDDIEQLNNEKSKLELIRDSLNLIQKTENETVEKTAKLDVQEMINSLALKIKQHEMSAQARFKAILDIASHGSAALNVMTMLTMANNLGQEQITPLRDFLTTLTSAQRKTLKEALFNAIKVMSKKERLDHDDGRFMSHINNAYIANHKTVLFEIFRMGDHEKIDHDTGTWKDFCGLMKKGRFLVSISDVSRFKAPNAAADPSTDAQQFTRGAGNNQL